MAKAAIKTFGKYQILERIATGGMAEIYKARLEGIGGFQRTFAIKTILPHLSQSAEYVTMLIEEARVAGLLSHANIVQILDLGQVDQTWYIAMEYVHGPDLGSVLRRCREKGIELPLPHTLFVAIELLKGLEYAHNKQVMRNGKQVPLNIIHRDISPPNVLLSMQGEVKLTDFGIARAGHTALETVSGVIKGRYDYMSPEQAAGVRDLDQRSDLFSVGVVLYEMLTGVHPFRADNELVTAERIRTGTYRPASEVNPGVPFTLETIVDRALRVDRNERYPSATSFKDALDKFFHDAGFLFTHHSLSQYIGGLFPDFKPGSARPQAEEPDDFDPPTEIEDDEELDAGEGPTRVIDRREVLRAEAEANAPALFGLRKDDTETLVRKKLSEAEWDDEQETLVRHTADLGGIDHRGPPRKAFQDDPQETVVRRRPDAPPSTRDRSLPDLRALEERSLAEPMDQGPVSPWVIGVAVIAGVLTFLIGLFLGGALGMLGANYMFNIRTAPPKLQVHAPPGVEVKVDGVHVQGVVQLEPGRQYKVEVMPPGAEGSSLTVSAGPGEVRVLTIQPVELPSAEPSDPAQPADQDPSE
ncbi:MAG: serine/threonine protein kinase [Deltaproteobacteria bacterium]|nr:MAG: serine/threonine protein kinase [Deltaproteobacteria bacterium]